MGVKVKVSIEDLIHVLFSGYFDTLVVLGQGIHDIDLPYFFCKSADHVPVGVLPPWGFERSAFGIDVALSISWGNVKVPSDWAVAVLDTRFRIHESFWFPSVWVEPVGDIGSSIQHDWIDQVAGMVLLNQLS